MKFFLSTFCLLMAGCLTAQNLTGIWRGSFTNMLYERDASGNRIALPADHYKFEVQIAQTGNEFKSVTYSYLSTVFYGKAVARGTVNSRNGKVFLEEQKLVEVKMSSGGGACAMTLFMQYTKSGKEEFLEGTFTSMNVADSTRCGGGKVFLRKVPVSDFYKEPMVAQREKELEAERNKPTHIRPKTDAPVVKAPAAPEKKVENPKSPAKEAAKKTESPPLPPAVVTPLADNSRKEEPPVEIKSNKLIIQPPAILKSRDNELVKTISSSAKDIQIRIYDNGTVDNDTISVYLDNKLVISRARLTEKAIPLTIHLDDTEAYHELVMVAENLGDIPPNTSLMVVNAGDKEYEVRITSNEQKNAMIIFKYQKN